MSNFNFAEFVAEAERTANQLAALRQRLSQTETKLAKIEGRLYRAC